MHGVTLVPAAASCRCRRRQGRVLDLRLFAGQAATRAGSAPPRAGTTPFPSGHSHIAGVRHLWCSSPRTVRCRSVGSSLAPRLATGPKGWQCCPRKAQAISGALLISPPACRRPSACPGGVPEQHHVKIAFRTVGGVRPPCCRNARPSSCRPVRHCGHSAIRSAPDPTGAGQGTAPALRDFSGGRGVA